VSALANALVRCWLLFFILRVIFLREQNRRNFNAIMIAGAGQKLFVRWMARGSGLLLRWDEAPATESRVRVCRVTEIGSSFQRLTAA